MLNARWLLDLHFDITAPYFESLLPVGKQMKRWCALRLRYAPGKRTPMVDILRALQRDFQLPVLPPRFKPERFVEHSPRTESEGVLTVAQLVLNVELVERDSIYEIREPPSKQFTINKEWVACFQGQPRRGDNVLVRFPTEETVVTIRSIYEGDQIILGHNARTIDAAALITPSWVLRHPSEGGHTPWQNVLPFDMSPPTRRKLRKLLGLSYTPRGPRGATWNVARPEGYFTGMAQAPDPTLRLLLEEAIAQPGFCPHLLQRLLDRAD